MSVKSLNTSFARMQAALPALLASASIALSAWLTVQFGVSLQLSSSVSVVVAIGLVWELAKYTFAREGWRLVASFRPREVIAGACLLGLALVLVAGSVTASVAAIESVRAEEREEGVSRSMQAEAAALMRGEIEVLLASAREDVRLGYRARANVTQGKIEQVRDELDALQSSAVLTAEEFSLFPHSSATWWVICVTVAVMLDAISVVSVAIAGGGSRSSPEARRSGDALKRAIAGGKVRPTYREVMSFGEGCSQEDARGILDDLEACGITERHGRGWRLSA